MEAAVQSNQPQMFQNAYQESQVRTASREDLILMLYDGAIRFMNQALEAMAECSWGRSSWALLRAQKIVHYLDLSLNLQEGGEIARNLVRLYDFIGHCLSEGLLRKECSQVEVALEQMRLLRNTWRETFYRAEGGTVS
jgi:flagellar protein FliS